MVSIGVKLSCSTGPNISITFLNIIVVIIVIVAATATTAPASAAITSISVVFSASDCLAGISQIFCECCDLGGEFGDCFR